MITAKEAHVMSDPEVREHLEFIEAAIIYAARDKHHEVIIKTYPYCTYFGVVAYYETTRTVISTLTNNGFEVEKYYSEYPSVEVGICIRWSEA